MNKVLMALAIAGFFYSNAAAQKTNKKVARVPAHKKAIVKDTVIMNFKVCKGDNGYTICGETPGNHNSTYEAPKNPAKHPGYEDARPAVIVLKGIPVVPKVPFPYDKPGPETQSGTFLGITSWNGIW